MVPVWYYKAHAYHLIMTILARRMTVPGSQKGEPRQREAVTCPRPQSWGTADRLCPPRPSGFLVTSPHLQMPHNLSA